MTSTLSRCSLAAVTLAVGMNFSGCAAPPPIRLHSLLPVGGPVRAMPVLPGFAYTLTSLSVPPQVDQPQWLVRQADGTLSLLEQERWVAPLRGELQAALQDRWIHSWGGRASSAVQSKEASWRVSLDVTRWDAMPGRAVRLESRWTVTSGTTTLTCRSVIQEGTMNDDSPLTLALAASHRRAVVRLADEVASRISEVQKGEPARCSDAPG